MVPNRLREIIDSAMNHRLVRPDYQRDTMLHDIEIDGLERQEIVMGIEDELSCDLGSCGHEENWQSIADICAAYETLGGA